jgi:hypothetical protein
MHLSQIASSLPIVSMQPRFDQRNHTLSIEIEPTLPTTDDIEESRRELRVFSDTGFKADIEMFLSSQLLMRGASTTPGPLAVQQAPWGIAHVTPNTGKPAWTCSGIGYHRRARKHSVYKNKSRFPCGKRLLSNMAPRAGLEPATNWLTANRSTD